MNLKKQLNDVTQRRNNLALLFLFILAIKKVISPQKLSGFGPKSNQFSAYLHVYDWA